MLISRLPLVKNLKNVLADVVGGEIGPDGLDVGFAQHPHEAEALDAQRLYGACEEPERAPQRVAGRVLVPYPSTSRASAACARSC